MKPKIEITALKNDLLIESFLLSLDGEASTRTQFLSHWKPLKKSKNQPKQLIATPITAKLIQNFDKNALVLPCDYGRIVTLGNLSVSPVNDGCGFGSSGLKMESPTDSLLYLAQFRTKHTPQLPQVKRLLLKFDNKKFGYGFLNDRQKSDLYFKKLSAINLPIQLKVGNFLECMSLLSVFASEKIRFKLPRVYLKALQCLIQQPDYKNQIAQVLEFHTVQNPDITLFLRDKKLDKTQLSANFSEFQGAFLKNMEEILRATKSETLLFTSQENSHEIESLIQKQFPKVQVKSLTNSVQQTLF